MIPTQDANQQIKKHLITSVTIPIILVTLGVGAGLFFQQSRGRVPAIGRTEAFVATTVTARIYMDPDGSCYQRVDPDNNAVLTGFPWMHEPQGSTVGDTITWTAADAKGTAVNLEIDFPSGLVGGNTASPFFDGSGKAITKLTIPASGKTFGPTGTGGSRAYGDFYFATVLVGGNKCSNVQVSATGNLGVSPMGVHVEK